MGRKGYIFINADNIKANLFKEFLKMKKMTQKQIAEIYMEAVMLSIDSELYLELKKKYYKVDKINQMIK